MPRKNIKIGPHDRLAVRGREFGFTLGGMSTTVAETVTSGSRFSVTSFIAICLVKEHDAERARARACCGSKRSSLGVRDRATGVHSTQNESRSGAPAIAPR